MVTDHFIRSLRLNVMWRMREETVAAIVATTIATTVDRQL